MPIVIKYTNYSDGIHNIDFTEDAAKLGLHEPFVGNVLLNCRMDKAIHQIILDCDLEVKAALTCDRCAGEFENLIKTKFELVYLFNEPEEDNDDSNVKFLSHEDDKLVLDGDVVEYANLSLPMKVLCREDCKGLCYKCGKNLNEGPCNCSHDTPNDVWEPLLKLKNKLNN